MGAYGNTIQASRSAATFPGSPKNLVAVAGDSQIALVWQAPTYSGGSPLTGYKVYRGTSAVPKHR